MFEEILTNYLKTSFDFRKYTCREDELSYLFEEWIDYYKMKYAIAKALQPKSILEIGVRYGYSAIAFLEASENGTYLGIDNNSNTFGGKEGAIDWAKKITEDFDAEFLLADTQSMTSFPGEFYDLIHIDGQQDGDGTFHDLELALEKGKWILVDGYFWSNENLLSSTHFIKKYKDFIECAIILPSYAGELLLKTNESAKNIFNKYNDKKYSVLEKMYSEHYFLEDCGGFESFKRNKGLALEDHRLIATYQLTDPHVDMEILDIGCGRGELSYALSLAKAKVTGIDYSESAIEIAKETFLNNTLTNNLNFIKNDFLNYNFNKKFDRIIATDFVEHIEAQKLQLMVQKISSLLTENGIFIIHTAPNKLYYQHAYEEKRKMAKEAGGYLPKNPRTFYEDMMHINEQTPQNLNDLLSEYFPFVLTWVSTSPDLVGSLSRPFSWQECINARDIYCVASFKTINKDSIIHLLTQQKLNPKKVNIELFSPKTFLELPKGEKITLDIDVSNNGEEGLVSLPPYPVHISYHWMRENGDFEIYDGVRTGILPLLRPKEKRQFKIDLVTPEVQGKYTLQLTLVQEQCFWFDEATDHLPLNIEVIIK